MSESQIVRVEFSRPEDLPSCLPMRGGAYVARIVVPRDMTREEAERLCALVMSLALPEDHP